MIMMKVIRIKYENVLTCDIDQKSDKDHCEAAEADWIWTENINKRTR